MCTVGIFVGLLGDPLFLFLLAVPVVAVCVFHSDLRSCTLPDLEPALSMSVLPRLPLWSVFIHCVP